MFAVGPTNAQLLQLLRCHEEELVRALSSANLLKLSDDLLKNAIISKDMKSTFDSLDYDRLDSQLVARYMLSQVFVRIESGSVGYSNLVRGLSGAGGCVRQLVGIINQEIAPDSNAADSDVSMTLYSDDASVLLTCLIQCSHKWEELGIALGLPVHVIVECNNAASNKTKLYRVLTSWLTAEHPRAKKSTLAGLKEALVSPLVGEGRLASNLKEIYTKAMRDELGHLPESTDQESTQFQLVHQSSATEVADHKSALMEVQVSLSESVVSYQWMKDSQPLSDSSNFSGACSKILLINQASIGSEGEYCCLVSNGKQQLTSTSASLTILYPSEKKQLLNLYSNLRDIPDNSWPIVSTKAFIDLVLIQTSRLQNRNPFIEEELEALLGDKQEIEYKDAFKQYVSGALVLVEGRPGSGKTTLANKIAKDWADGKVLKNTDKVFLISLRKDLESKDLYKVFYHSKAEEFMRNIDESQGDKACFILDGYDEFSPKDEDSSVLYQLINKTYLPLAMIIITSRPTATADLRQRVTITIESLGFTKQNLDLYINSYPFEVFENAEEFRKLKSILKACTNVMNMCYLPLNASIVCFLCSQGLGDSELLKTETQIYERLVIAIMLRKIRQQKSSVQLCSLRDLKGENKVHFSKLCSLAFRMTIENRQIVHQLPIPIDRLNESPFRGLLVIDSIAKLHGLEDVVTFLHLTLQEYLAAYHLSSLDDDQQRIVIQSLKGGKSSILAMLKFYCGLVDFTNKESHFCDIIVTPHDTNKLFLVHCAYESQQRALSDVAARLIGGELDLFYCTLTSADFTALGYVISNASHLVNKVCIKLCKLFEDSLAKKWEKNGDVKKINVDHGIQSSHSAITDAYNAINTLKVLQVSYKRHKQFYPWLHKLAEINKYMLHYRDNHDSPVYNDKMENRTIISNSTTTQPFIDALLKCSNLKKLDLSNCLSNMESAHIVKEIIQTNDSLEFLEMSHEMNPGYAGILAQGLNNCKHLSKIQFTRINLQSEGGESFLMALQNCITLHTLALADCEIFVQGANALAYGIKPLVHLSLEGNHIGPEGVKVLAREGCFKCLKSLNLSYNSIGSEGVVAVCDILKESSCNFQSLILNYNQIDSSGIKILADGLHYCPNLRFLSLCLNSIGPDGAAALVTGLKFCATLQYMFFDHCNITSEGLKTFCGFNYWIRLTTLDLTMNKIGSLEVQFLTGMMLLPYLEELYLSHNQIDRVSAGVLGKKLPLCPRLKVLNVSHNKICAIGAASIAKGLLYTSNIKYVNLSHNSIGCGNMDLLATLVGVTKRSHLELLDLAHNSMGRDGIVALMVHLIFCKHLVKLNISGNYTSPEISQFVAKLKKLPTNLTVYLK